MSDKRVLIFDTTLRDGEQSPGCSMNLEEKLMLARQLEKLGVDVIEAGFPIASQGDFEAVRAVAREVRRPIICALARTANDDVDRAWEALREAAQPRIHVFIATSEIHMRDKLRMSTEQVLAEVVRAVSPRARLLRGRRVLLRGRHALRLGVPGRGLQARDRGRRAHAQHPRHGRLHDARSSTPS